MPLRALDPTVGVVVRELRVVGGLSQEALAARAGIASATLRSFELGQKLPHRSTLVAIAVALELTLENLLGLVAERRAAAAPVRVIADPDGDGDSPPSRSRRSSTRRST